MAVAIVTMSALLCKSKAFGLYLDDARRCKKNLTKEQMPDGTHNEEDAADFLRSACGVMSRSEIGDSDHAKEMLFKINRDYLRWCSRNDVNPK